MSEFYAKRYEDNFETLEEHTDNLIKNFHILKAKYKDVLENIGIDDNILKALEFACIFHDLGKMSKDFQDKITNKKKNPKEIPHNFLSGLFLFNNGIEKHLNDGFDRYFGYLIYAVLYHHHRTINVNEKVLKEIFEEDLKPKIVHLGWLSKYNIIISNIEDHAPYAVYAYLSTYGQEVKNYIKNKEAIFIKGMLHRIDHSASAHVDLEKERILNARDILNNYISKKGGFRDFQIKAKELSDKNALLTASTGLGKTEFALNWIGEDKVFYTLPVRVSVNAMYNRLSNLFGEDNVGLLHSFAKFDMLDDGEIEPILDIINHSSQLSMPLTVCTADQLFTSVFKYHGFEKIYATLMYSKVVIDEPQGYSPDTLAYIVKAIKELKEYGGRFLVMSATMHPFIKEELGDFEKIIEFSKDKKHFIRISDKSITELTDEIADAYEDKKKVLVIVNTVKKSQEVYKLLKAKNINVKLLHSLFIRKDRKIKEQEIISNNKEPVVWVSTQLVEASLDIDYDMLYTELASIDSLIQRMGRVLRHRKTEPTSPNVIITIKDISGIGSVYYKEVVEQTRAYLENFDNKFMTEEDKQAGMDFVYDENKVPKFYKQFKNNLDLLTYGYQADDKKEAERLFREIYNVDVIPQDIFSENRENIDTLIDTIKEEKSVEKLRALKQLYDYTVPIPYYRVQNKLSSINLKNVFVFYNHYDDEFGIVFDEKDNLVNYV